MSITYLPARIVSGHRWYIIYYQSHPDTGERQRFRETHNLNRIPDLQLRRKRAEEICTYINARLPFGYPYDANNQLNNTKLIDAINSALQLKSANLRMRSQQTLSSTRNIFNCFLRYKGWEHLKVIEFDRKKALAYLDYTLLVRGISNRTYNNYLERIRSLFVLLVDREYLTSNPFSGLGKKKAEAKRRRALNLEEKKIMANYIRKNDPWLYLGIALQYYCFIRPIELRRLRFFMIDLQDSLIRLSGAETKNREVELVTIPDVFRPYLKNFNFGNYQDHYLIFGEGVRPHPEKPCGHDTLNSRHREILKKLKKRGKLKNIEGLSFYSWKDTGALELFKQKVNMLEIMRQLRHKDLATTQKYCQSLYAVNFEIKGLNNQLATAI